MLPLSNYVPLIDRWLVFIASTLPMKTVALRYRPSPVGFHPSSKVNAVAIYVIKIP
jgi:hypothetical protein